MAILKDITRNSYHIKRSYALYLKKYLLNRYPDDVDSIEFITQNIKTSDSQNDYVYARSLIDSVVASLDRIMFNKEPTSDMSQSVAGPSQSYQIQVEPPQNDEISVSLVETPIDNDTLMPLIEINNNEAQMPFVQVAPTEDLYRIVSDLLENTSLQSISKHTLQELKQLLENPTSSLADLYKQKLVLDNIDCTLYTQISEFVELYKKNGGVVECVDIDVNYYAKLVQANSQLLDTLPPTIRAAVVSILDKVTNKKAYETYLNIDAAEYKNLDNELIKLLLNKYKLINFSKKRQIDRSADLSTDEEQTITDDSNTRRLRRANVAKRRATAADIAPTLSANETFIANVKQLHKNTVIMPPLLVHLLAVMPTTIGASMLTCPSEGFGTNLITISNYNSTINKIKKLNLTILTNTIYFYKLLEPLTMYGTGENETSKMIWFIVKSSNYFVNNARNFDALRKQLQGVIDDPDRVALFMIRYNFLWFYRQFASKLVNLPTTSFPNQKIMNVLYVYDSIVQKKYNSINYQVSNRVYVGPVDNVVKLMVASYSDILA
ncbi:Vp80 [Helicoverpa armigera multiple nucleopolyhedrovirus]|uniref:Vp80 n=1 Tax=Mamestra brassicae nuclear polyhedrosis virus TaxID=78219 RepID=A0A077D2T8_NPVMB|nr:Vp80 [Helicoverpa armigera multiple nucleopolyhedrovirus]AIL25152.1 vp80 [Mamestra brassicae multiple nucleopolyhedrovirus]